MELIRHITRPDELLAIVKFKLGRYDGQSAKFDLKRLPPCKRRCYELLNQTSRSFATVIQELHEQLRDAVCIFYLVLRALDTVEDDMTIPDEEKLPLLRAFHEKLEDPSWCFLDSHEKDKDVLIEFSNISSEYRALDTSYQQVISDICSRMGEGMAEFINQAPTTMADWDQYCHYVAGLVGIGLSRLFSASKLEDKLIGYDTRTANSMGLFLQKTNIIRDYLEDVQQGREFWPQEAWGKYADKLGDFQKPENRTAGLYCLNELVTNALEHIPDVIKYLGRIKDPSVFRFCAIPQVMAVATLERCYNNPRVFDGVVKIRKGEAVKMILGTSSLEATKAVFKHFCSQMELRVPEIEPCCLLTRSVLTRSLLLTDTTEKFVSSPCSMPFYITSTVLAAVLLWQYYHQGHQGLLTFSNISTVN